MSNQEFDALKSALAKLQWSKDNDTTRVVLATWDIDALLECGRNQLAAPSAPVEQAAPKIHPVNAYPFPLPVKQAAPVMVPNKRPNCDREADRTRFPDPLFNKWLDESISDAGHTVWDQIGNAGDAWAGWENRPYYSSGDRQRWQNLDFDYNDKNSIRTFHATAYDAGFAAAGVPSADAQELQRLREIARLIGAIFVHGDFKAETYNERELEKLLREQGAFFDEELDKAVDALEARYAALSAQKEGE